MPDFNIPIPHLPDIRQPLDQIAQTARAAASLFSQEIFGAPPKRVTAPEVQNLCANAATPEIQNLSANAATPAAPIDQEQLHNAAAALCLSNNRLFNSLFGSEAERDRGLTPESIKQAMNSGNLSDAERAGLKFLLVHSNELNGMGCEDFMKWTKQNGVDMDLVYFDSKHNWEPHGDTQKVVERLFTGVDHDPTDLLGMLMPLGTLDWNKSFTMADINKVRTAFGIGMNEKDGTAINLLSEHFNEIARNGKVSMDDLIRWGARNNVSGYSQPS